MQRVTNAQMLEEVRRLRAAGCSPQEIARALGVRPAVIRPLVRALAADEPPASVAQAPVQGCWVSPGWSSELQVDRREGWDDVDLGPEGPAGMALVLVARSVRHTRVSVCGYLLDTFCLGVKNAIGPEQMHVRDLPGLVQLYFAAFPGSGLRAPIELAQHLVLGVAAFAEGIGLAPHPDFAATRDHLGQLAEPCAISFGREGRPTYVAGPYDDPIAVLETLRETLGNDGFAVAA